MNNYLYCVQCGKEVFIMFQVATIGPYKKDQAHCEGCEAYYMRTTKGRESSGWVHSNFLPPGWMMADPDEPGGPFYGSSWVILGDEIKKEDK